MKSFLLICLALLASHCKNIKNSKILYINSYHKGYPSSDSVEAGIKRVFDDKNIDLNVFYYDTKRNDSYQAITQKTDSLNKIYSQFKPDIVIVSDDNAVQYFVVPFLKKTKTPTLFCGVNWTAHQYGLPSKNITGMLEVLPLDSLIKILKQEPYTLNRAMIINENSLSAQNDIPILDSIFRNNNISPIFRLVDNCEQWEEAFIYANDSCDFIYIPTNGAIKNWEKERMKAFVKKHIKKPVVTCDDFMMDYATLGLTKVAAEQGEWCAKKAIEVLKGKPINKIPVAKNQKVVKWINHELIIEK